MSQIFRFSGSYLLLITTVLFVGLSIETGSCEDTVKWDYSDDYSYITDVSSEGPQGETLSADYQKKDLGMKDLTTVSSQDFQTAIASSNGPLGLWSGLQTGVMTLDNDSLQKYRKAGLFTYGSDMLEINEYSWLDVKDNLGYEYEDTLLDQSIILENAKYPFAMYREDLTDISYDWSKTDMDPTPFIENTTSKTYLLLDRNYYDAYDISSLDAAFGSTDIYEKFEYDPDMSKLSSELGIDLSVFFPPDLWALFAEMFHEFAVAELEKQKNEQNQDNEEKQKYIDNMFDDCSSGVCCKWGTSS